MHSWRALTLESLAPISESKLWLAIEEGSKIKEWALHEYVRTVLATVTFVEALAKMHRVYLRGFPSFNSELHQRMLTQESVQALTGSGLQEHLHDA
eukprot:CAMPEP_0115688072 /NCGR_PEP_ID=MMETSP0272-20121206/60815_1 /TAXON_ID=71861 /ORGANISM="Scrippsiella trochoidea, Strain CCMP3099" /LENGTH=95 /DNA_ID=CAMNT_0003127735 /DNA_START=903 /DNA_END=1187 /DNA_ORIENTATION=+